MYTTAFRPSKRGVTGSELESHEELNIEEGLDIQRRFEVISDLGNGAYGTVYKARDKGRGGEVIALKKVYVREEPGIGIPAFVMREIANLNRLSSPPNKEDPNIVRLLDVHSVEGRYPQEVVFYLVFEHMDQDLDQFIRLSPSSGMDKLIVKDFLWQILNGVDWMHVNTIVHRDLKPQNILVSQNGKHLKIADFGLSRLIGSNVVLSTQVVTQWYRAPEVLLHSSYCKSVDIWSVGCIFAEMITGRALFAAKRNGEKPQLEQIFSVIGTPTALQWPLESSISPDQFEQHRPRVFSVLIPNAGPNTLELLSMMLEFQSAKRITADRALHSEFFSKQVISQD